VASIPDDSRSEPFRRVRLDPEARRAQIVDAAYELLETHGVGAMAVDEVADAAGVSRSLVYTYFGDRDGLVAEVYQRVLQRLADEVPGFADGAYDRGAVTTRIASCLRFARAHPAAWRLLVTDSVRRHPAVVQARAAKIARLTAGLDGARVPLVADAVWGLVEAGVLHWVEQPNVDIDQAADVLATTLWSGLAKLRTEI
jgi:AcrR family transcriptional regulator